MSDILKMGLKNKRQATRRKKAFVNHIADIIRNLHIYVYI